MPYMKKFVKTTDGFEMLRGETRTIHCPNKLWEELLNQTHGICSVSEYIKIAILEKMCRDEPTREEYFKDFA